MPPKYPSDESDKGKTKAKAAELAATVAEMRRQNRVNRDQKQALADHSDFLEDMKKKGRESEAALKMAKAEVLKESQKPTNASETEKIAWLMEHTGQDKEKAKEMLDLKDDNVAEAYQAILWTDVS
ncbi:hypothetical protein EJ08DRAFT_653467 [Tothia fuscella]|uniref:Uncharacterized protein n=1 Tax=Tothia fuscella TaxID=1048955 RepID=A0A9P4NHF7_9PEZI|nr:hypothetical protein EJ08DRAFT_653467 [Tothia fuscella]